MPISEAQELFILIFAIYFTLIIDRANRTYNPYDTYKAWKGRGKALRRLILSWTVLHILPLLNFAIFFIILGLNNTYFNPNLLGVTNIVLVGLLAFFDFGYYRIFEAFLYLSPQKFLTDKERKEVLNEERFEFRAHMIPGILYVVITWLILIILLIINNI
ncbi:MAG: hypothetical protein ACXVHS_10350 [Methanobacterium sp.]